LATTIGSLATLRVAVLLKASPELRLFLVPRPLSERCCRLTCGHGLCENSAASRSESLSSFKFFLGHHELETLVMFYSSIVTRLDYRLFMWASTF
jgi:hypothetical protein